MVAWDSADPVVCMLSFVSVIVRVMESLVSIIFKVDLSSSIKIIMHLEISISVSQLNVVMERNSREWVEIIWIDWFGNWH